MVNGVSTSRLRGPRLKKCAAPLSRLTTPVLLSLTGSTLVSVFALRRRTD
jgi:hypothetical protein